MSTEKLEQLMLEQSENIAALMKVVKELIERSFEKDGFQELIKSLGPAE